MTFSLTILKEHDLTLEEIRKYAIRQTHMPDGNKPPICFTHDGKPITNPWRDPSDSCDITTKDALATYGKYNVLYFVEETAERIVAERLSPSGDGKSR